MELACCANGRTSAVDFGVVNPSALRRPEAQIAFARATKSARLAVVDDPELPHADRITAETSAAIPTASGPAKVSGEV
jgi:hypothetical protein